jgi:drug/metabolite transporter (DMT)-like permease
MRRMATATPQRRGDHVLAMTRSTSHLSLTVILLIVAAAACFTTIDTTVKYLGQRYPVPLLAWGRYSIQALLMVAILGPKLRWGLVRTGNPRLHLVRGLMLLVSSLCFFTALKFLPLAEATAINYSTPVLVTLMAGYALREKITRPRWMFVIGGFVGVMLIVRPGSSMLQPAVLFALAAASAYAIFQILTRRLAGENLMVLLFIPSIVGTVLMSAIVPFFHYDSHYPTSDILLFVGIGGLATLGHSLFAKAFQLAPASAIAPFTYVQLVWSTISGWLAFGTFPDAWAMTGMLVIAGSGVALTWYERWRDSLPQSEPAAVD